MSAGGNSHNLLAGLLVGGLLAAYAALSYYISLLPEGNPWAVLIAVLPVAAMLLDLLRRALGMAATLLATALGVAALVLAWPHMKDNVSWIYFLQHVAINVSLGLIFARTLGPGRQPLCTFFATFIHHNMSPAVISYTRQVTAAWAIFFFGVTGISLLLFPLASLQTWSLFANLLNPLLVVLMFVAENQARRFFLPPADRMGIADTIRAYQTARKARPEPAPPQNIQP